MISKDSLLWQQVCRAVLICCNEKEALGIEKLYNSDIYDVQDILKAQGISVTYTDIEKVLGELIK